MKWFIVTATCDDDVSHLKNKIKEQCAPTFERVDARCLELWKVNIDINAYLNDGRSLSHLKFEPEGIESLQSWKSISEYWSGQLPDEFIHIMVKGVPAGESATGRNCSLSIILSIPRALHRNQTPPSVY